MKYKKLPEFPGSGWESLFETEKSLLYSIDENLSTESERIFYPPSNRIFYAYKACPLQNLKVVILGQDPYHGEGEAHGLAFSVPPDIKIPPSLKNIFKELKNDLSIEVPTSGSLESWAKEGVFLLNAILTVEKDKPGSHSKLGWEKFTDSTIRFISDKKENIVFILWGKFAQKKEALIDIKKHFVIKSAHPSPLGARYGFWDSKPFSRANEYLEKKKLKPINWGL